MLGRVDFERLAGVRVFPPKGDEFLIGFTYGCYEHAAAWMQLLVGAVNGFRMVNLKECFDGGDLFLEGRSRCPVVVSLGNQCCLSDLRPGKVRTLGVAGFGNYIILERLFVWLNSQRGVRGVA